MRVGVIGAGPSGLVTAAVLQEHGHEVVVFEKAPDIGGVWSATRSYPGLSTQDDRVTYAFSDLPMPAHVPEHPAGADVRAYLQHYAQVHGLPERIHLDTRVTSAETDAGTDGWVVQTVGPTGPAAHDVDWLVVANGVFSTPHVPAWPGEEEFRSSGGQVVLPTALGGGSALVGKRVVVVGWGKTACDVAVQSTRLASSTAVVARAIRWKIPKRLPGGLSFRHLLLTRFGEHLMTAARTSYVSTVVALAGLPVRRTVLWLLRRQIAHRSGLAAIGLVPSLPLPHSDSLVTDGFFEAVGEGRLAVHRDVSVHSLGGIDGVSGVRLTDGSWLPADVVVPATGFDQDLSFLAPAVRAALLDEDGVLALHRRMLPLAVPRLSFAGWGHTYRSPLTAEIGAVWLAAHLAGALPRRTPAELRRTADRYHLTHHQAAARGEGQVPSGSFAAVDLLLDDLGLPLPARIRRRQWLTPLDPASYAYLRPGLRRRLGLAGDDDGTATDG